MNKEVKKPIKKLSTIEQRRMDRIKALQAPTKKKDK